MIFNDDAAAAAAAVAMTAATPPALSPASHPVATTAICAAHMQHMKICLSMAGNGV